MAMILDAFMNKFCKLLVDFIQEEVIMLLGVKGELQTLLQRMKSIQSLLKDAEKRKFDESSIDLWLSELKDFMYDADDIIDLCRIEGAQLLADQNPKSKASPVCCNFSSPFSFCTSVPFRHEIGNRIKELNDRLNRIYQNRKQFKLEKSTAPETPQITQVDQRQTSSMVDPSVVGKEVEVASNKLVNLLVAENKKVKEKCRLFVVSGMGGIGKTTLAQKIFNHHKIQSRFNLKVWTCVSQTFSEIELLQQIIREAKGSYGNAKTKSELLPCLSNTVASGESLFIVLDDVWRADVWVNLLRVPLYNANTTVRVLVTTRDENIAEDMKAADIHRVMKLSVKSGWDMLCKQIFSDEEEELANGLKEIGFKIVEKCECLPLAIKAIVSVLNESRTKKAWENVLMNEAWSITNLPEESRGALYLSFEVLPSPLKQCFLYFSLYREDAFLHREEFTRLWIAEGLHREEFTRLWIAEGLITEQQHSLMENLAEVYFNELVKRNFLQPLLFKHKDAWSICKMHDLMRSLALFLSKGENSCGDVNVNNSITSIKLRRLSVKDKQTATEILDSVAEQGVLRTLLASRSDLLLDDERLRQLLCLRVLDIAGTKIEILPNSIKNLVHLRYLDLSFTNITTIPKHIEHLTFLQFLNIRSCKKLTQLPSEITLLHNLRFLNLSDTPLSFMPKGIEKLQLLNHLNGFVVINDDSSSKLEELSTLKQMRTLSILNLDRAQSGANILRDLLYLSDLELHFSKYSSEPNAEEKLAVEKLFDELKPPRSLEKLKIDGFFGSHFPKWMALSNFATFFPFLTRLEFGDITSCTQLPPLGQLPELKLLTIRCASKVKKIEPEFLGGGVISAVNSSNRIVFPKLEDFYIDKMPELEEWSFGAQVENNASTRLKLLPCLRKLEIINCPLLKQLPKGLKYSAMKILNIKGANSLKSLDDLPLETEELKLTNNENLEKICCPPVLKYLKIECCEALSSVEKLDSLQQLTLHFYKKMILPEWLLMFLRQWGPQNDANEDFLLKLKCPLKVLRSCFKRGSHWGIIKNIPEVILYGDFGRSVHYIKQPYFYENRLLLI